MVMHHATRLIRARTLEPEVLRELVDALNNGDVSLQETNKALAGSLSYVDLQLAMSSLEWLASFDAHLALLLMAGLYGLADELPAHDICDAIELWIESVGARSLIDSLSLHESRGSIAPAKAQEWIGMLRAKPAG